MMGGIWGGNMGGLSGGFGMFFIWIAVIALIVWGVASAVRSSQSPTHQTGLSAQDVARNRYAQGEINKEQYEQLRKDLA